MKSFNTQIGKLGTETVIYRGYTIPKKPAECFTETLNFLHKERFWPPCEVLNELLGVNLQRITQIEGFLINKGLYAGNRRKKTLKVSEKSIIGRDCARDLFFFDYLEKEGKRYIDSSLSETYLSGLMSRLEKETGIHEDFLAPQIDALKEKGYLREDERWLVLHKGKWIKEKMIVKEIYERGLHKYDIPENFIWNGLP